MKNGRGVRSSSMSCRRRGLCAPEISGHSEKGSTTKREADDKSEILGLDNAWNEAYGRQARQSLADAQCRAAFSSSASGRTRGAYLAGVGVLLLPRDDRRGCSGTLGETVESRLSAYSRGVSECHRYRCPSMGLEIVAEWAGSSSGDRDSCSLFGTLSDELLNFHGLEST